jgi:hypothetical protein
MLLLKYFKMISNGNLANLKINGLHLGRWEAIWGTSVTVFVMFYSVWYL